MDEGRGRGRRRRKDQEMEEGGEGKDEEEEGGGERREGERMRQDFIAQEIEVIQSKYTPKQKAHLLQPIPNPVQYLFRHTFCISQQKAEALVSRCHRERTYNCTLHTDRQTQQALNSEQARNYRTAYVHVFTVPSSMSLPEFVPCQ